MTNTTHNGWTNYATWRVALEFFDDKELWRNMAWRNMSASDCEDIVVEHIEAQSEGLARDYALAFLAEVNWHEISDHLADDEAA